MDENIVMLINNINITPHTSNRRSWGVIQRIIPTHSSEKKEPARHTMLKIKTTFIKVHGIGSLLVVTFPDIEKQGGNLTVECIIRGIQFAMTNANIPKIRNLYIQLDNVSSNKCYTIISSMTALVVCGVCKKIKIHYLVVGHTHETIDALIGIQVIYHFINIV